MMYAPDGVNIFLNSSYFLLLSNPIFVSDMPAVKVFAYNAGLAIVFNFILQVTAFLAVVKLDMDRQKAGRWDLIYCVKKKSTKDAVFRRTQFYTANWRIL